MTSYKKQNDVDSLVSQGLRVKQPFRSPLRVPGASKSEDKTNSNVGSSPTSQSSDVTRSVLHNASSSRLCNLEVSASGEGTLSKNVQKSDFINTTPKRPVIKSCPRKSTTHQIKGSPCQFSVPFRSPLSNAGITQQSISKEDELHQLLKYENGLDEEIITLKSLGYRLEELQWHIDNLHQYNETKDSAQLVMGRLAEIHGVTLKEMHDRYSVPTSE